MLTRVESDELARLYGEAGHDNGQLLNEDDEDVQKYIETRYITLLAIARKKKFFKIWKVTTTAAAVFIIAFLAGKVFYHANKNVTAQNKIVSGHNGAVLTLADGSKVILDSMGNGMVMQQQNVQVINTNGTLTYHTKSATAKQVVYNTLSTPRARQYKIVLPDGTKVWLNAESTIRYPTAFTGNDREVELTGEAYFEVVHNAAQPFKVKVGNNMVEDVGTIFDINAYADEPAIKTTLIEGAAKMNNKLLRPGEQAVANKSGHIQVNHVDAEQVIAWQKGMFAFDNTGLDAIMRQISRWYDVDVSYENGLTKEGFYGTISRYSSIQDILNMLELTGLVHFKIMGNEIIVQN
ncbi:FecR family protein [Arachidicoccus ginsenosidimutans]|uniref:FecR family protein n=1 Tax=Arachidicoccus sp. BS20 TaxID=1850526 RepID=UPI0018D363A7|nr:FecR family protein [Arachidicoccus sp. BS20]